MRKKLLALGLGIAGLGVPLLVAYFARRDTNAFSDQTDAPTTQGEDSAPLPRPTGPQRGAPRRTANGHILEPHPTGLFAAIGRFDYRFRKVLPVIGLALVIGLNIWAGQAGGKLIQGGWMIDGSEEAQATELLADRFGEQATTMLVVYRANDGNAASDAFQQKVRDSLDAVAQDAVVDKVTTYGETKAPMLLSRDRSATLAVITIDKGVEESVEDAARLADKVHTPQGATTYITGIPQLYH
jgi:hypothetical protein